MSGQDILADMLSSGSDPRDMSQQQVPEVREFLNSNLFAFNYFIMGYRDLQPSLHARMCKVGQKWGEPEWKRLMVQVPRDSFKTSILTRGGSLWRICRRPDEPVLIVNEKLERTQTWVRSIRDTVSTNLLFHAVYGDLLPPGLLQGTAPPNRWKWSDTELQFQRGAFGIPEASITGIGVTGASAGGHWPWIIMDDLISEDAVNQPTTMGRVMEWFDNSLYLEKPAMGGNVLIVCTHWAFGDVYDYILEKYTAGKVAYKLYRRSALEPGPDGELQSILPERWSKDELLIQMDRDPFNFWAQMMNQPRPSKQQDFDAAWFRYGHVVNASEPFFLIHDKHYDPSIGDVPKALAPREVPLYCMEKMLFVDPAPSEPSQITKERKARNGLVMMGIDPWGRRFVLDTWAGRPDPLSVAREIIKMCQKWGCYRFGIEKVAAQVYMKHWVLREAAQLGEHLVGIDLQTKGHEKNTRITGLIPLFRSGLMYLNEPQCGQLVYELRAYPSTSSTRDLVDAMAYSKDHLYRQESPEEANQRAVRERWEESDRDPITGYSQQMEVL